MNKIYTSIMRVAVLVAVFGFAMLMLFAVPNENCGLVAFIMVMAVTKSLAFYGFKFAHRLYEQWKTVDPIIGAYDRHNTLIED